MNRLNKYVHLIKTERHFFIYDISTQIAIALDRKIFELLENNRKDIDSLQSKHPELYEQLTKTGMIVDNGYDEISSVIEKFRAIDSDPTTYSIIVNPTLDCNLRCWYCYESHGRGTMMSEDTITSIKKLIDNKISEEKLEKLNLTFFGGEPLIGWNKVILPLLTYAVKECKDHDKKISVSFTSNGVLLSESKFNNLLDLGLNDTSFQITLDGNKTIHDNSRVGESRKPTYDIIMNNVRNGAEKGFYIHLRLNYTPENLPCFIDVLSDLEQLPEDARKHIQCNFQKVWQSGNNTDKDNAVKYVRIFQEAGINTTCDTSYSRHFCYADSDNQVTINYNGDLYKCTAREFNNLNREGVLRSDGFLDFNDRHLKRMNIRYLNTECHRCDILPLCNGGCTQCKIEAPDITSCIRNLSDKDRYAIILGSLYSNVFKKLLTLDELNKIR